MMSAARPQDAAQQREELVRWFLRRHGDAWSAADEAAFGQWLQADTGNRVAYARWEADWALIDAMPQEAAARLRTQVVLDRAARRSAPPVAPVSAGRRGVVASLAVAGVAGMALGGGWLGWQHLQAQPVYAQAFSTQRGQQSDVQLPDGSRLRLDTSTALQATLFRDRREVRLAQGQAWFSVRADADRPFHVFAGDVRVTVVGTRFSVRLTPGVPGREGVEVAVEQGRVHVARGSGAAVSPAAFDLVAGQRLVFGVQGEAPTVQTLAAQGAAPWRAGPQMSFDDVALKTAVAEMQRYADLGIVAIDPAAADLRLTGTFDPRDAAATRRLLAGALPLQLVPQGAGYAVRRQR